MKAKVKAFLDQFLKQPKAASFIHHIEEWAEESKPGETLITEDERLLLSNIFHFRGLTAHNIMKPRADIQGLDISSSFEDVVSFFQTTLQGYAPVYRDQLDDTLGIVYLNQVLPFYKDPEKFSLQKALVDVLFVSPSIRILELMIKMRVSRVNLALVVDEFGGIDGLVTLEDIIEEIVGQIQEPPSLETTPQLLMKEDGSYLVDARMSVEDLEKTLSTSLVQDPLDEDIQTLGGLLTHVAGRVPTSGELIRLTPHFECEIRDADPRRVKKALLSPLTPSPSKSLKMVHENPS